MLYRIGVNLGDIIPIPAKPSEKLPNQTLMAQPERSRKARHLKRQCREGANVTRLVRLHRPRPPDTQETRARPKTCMLGTPLPTRVAPVIDDSTAMAELARLLAPGMWGSSRSFC
jgi:hypothetical protein